MDKEKLQQIKTYLEHFGHLKANFGDCSKIYSMTTENISSFLDYVDVKDKKILTVGGSGDQLLNSYLHGASEVVCFDINPLAKLHIDLKSKALSKLNYEKFIKFFGIYSRRFSDYYTKFDSRIFSEFSHLLNEDTYEFYDFFINNGDFIDTDVYYKFNNELKKLKVMNSYLKEEEYYKLADIIKNKSINFINTNVTSLKEKISTAKYDLILLSNISDYINELYPSDDLNCYYNLIISLKDNLNKDGVIEVGYIYQSMSRHLGVSDFSDDKIRNKVFNEEEFSTVYVPSYDDLEKKDKVIVYKHK